MAQEHSVSRKFLYQQKEKALSGIDFAFEETIQDDVLFWLPVTKAWLRQVVLVLILHCHSSFRGVIKACTDLFGTSISLGTVFTIVQEATEKAEDINEKQDVSNVVHGAHDEVFQKNMPVLTGVDIPSLSCCLLSEQDHRDAETWGFLLLYLEDQGFSPDYTIAVCAVTFFCDGKLATNTWSFCAFT